MSSPLIWIVAPGLVAVFLYLIRRWETVVILLGTSAAAGLALFAWKAPIGDLLRLGPLTLELSDTLTVLGRRFILSSSDQPLLILIYLALAFWFAGASITQVDPLFVPLGMMMASLLTAVSAVEPFLYAALLIEMVALLSIPLLITPGKRAGRGVIRFLTFQTLGMPFLLLAGWVLSGLEADPGNTALTLRANFCMALGFIFFLGIFPFHTWIPMLAEEGHPYTTAFVFFVLPVAISLFGITFLERYPWMRADPGLNLALQTAGGLTVVVGGIWAAFQKHLGRLMGFAVMVEIGLSLLAIPAGAVTDGRMPTLNIFFALLLPRGLALGVLGMALTSIKNCSPDLRFRAVRGMALKLPIASVAVVLAYFSLAGFPLLAGFPVHLALWEHLAIQSPFVALTALFGGAGLLVGGLRMLAVLVMGNGEETVQLSESWGERLLLTVGGTALFVVGLFPQWFFPVMVRLASTFTQTGQ
jgi:formate hydrogenlyase subunit 3/multisubunit Na+/H+ antiporter MnhD subunit